MVQNLPANARDIRDRGLILGSGRSPGGVRSKPTPVFLPGESHGQRSLAGYSPWGRKKSDTTERLTQFSEVNKLCHVNHLDKKQLLLWIRHTANIVKYRSWTVVQYNFVVFHIIIVKKIPTPTKGICFWLYPQLTRKLTL